MMGEDTLTEEQYDDGYDDYDSLPPVAPVDVEGWYPEYDDDEDDYERG